MTHVPLSSETMARLDASFSDADRGEAKRLLVEKCGSNLPLYEDSDASSLERIRFSALKLGNGDLSALRAAVDQANTEWRDLLVMAGFADDIHAHESWFPGEEVRS